MLIKTVTKVEKLTKRVERFYDNKQTEEDRQKKRQERENIIRSAPRWCYTDFWCSVCGDVPKQAAYKVVQTDWTNSNQRIAYYEAFRSCHKGLRRWITDKNQDPYFRQSQMIIKQAKEAQAKGWLLQPYDFGFNLKYPEHNRKLNARKEAEERAKYAAKHQHH